MKSSRISAVLASIALIAGAAVLSACGSDSDDPPASSTTEKSQKSKTVIMPNFDSELLEPGTLTVGSDIPYPPFEFGKEPPYKGFDVDIVNEIGNDLDLKVDIRDTAFDTIFTDVAQGKFDMVASAATITPERQETVNFSDPYYETEQALLVTPGSDISSVEDLSGTTVGAQDGTTGEAYANDETDAENVRGFPNAPAALDALRAGQVDAVILDLGVADDAVEKSPEGYELASQIPTGEKYGFAFAKKNTGLVDAVNNVLAKMKEDGRLGDLYQKWFKTDVPKGVLDGTTKNPD